MTFALNLIKWKSIGLPHQRGKIIVSLIHTLMSDTKDTILRVISAGERAVDELIKVAEEKIITGHKDDELAADRLKNAAATKRLAIEDAFAILQRIENERDKLNGEDQTKDGKGKDTGFQSFAESRGRKS